MVLSQTSLKNPSSEIGKTIRVKSHHASTLVKRRFHRFNRQRILKLAMAADVFRQQGKMSKAVGLMSKCVKCILESENRKAYRNRRTNATRNR